MRFDTKVTFKTPPVTEYNPRTGNYEIIEEAKEYVRYANVNDTTMEIMEKMYGNILKGAKTVRLKNTFEEEFEVLEFNGKTYVQTHSRYFRSGKKKVFFVQER